MGMRICKIYANNFRKFVDFTLDLSSESSVLLIGKNGSGKSSIADILRIFQRVGAGQNIASSLINSTDFKYDDELLQDKICNLEIEFSDKKSSFQYQLAFKYPAFGGEIELEEEKLSLNKDILLLNKEGKVTLKREGVHTPSSFEINSNSLMLPSIGKKQNSGIDKFLMLLRKIIVLRPVPSLMTGISSSNQFSNLYGIFTPDMEGRNIVEWLTSFLSKHPSSSKLIVEIFQQLVPTFQNFKISSPAGGGKEIFCQFQPIQDSELPFKSLAYSQLSSGEKIFLIYALLYAQAKSDGPIFCFWDEPDNYVTLSEIQGLMDKLREAFKEQGQILIASHGEETILQFTDEDTFVLRQKNFDSPPEVKRLLKLREDKEVQGDLIDAIQLNQL